MKIENYEKVQDIMRQLRVKQENLESLLKVNNRIDDSIDVGFRRCNSFEVKGDLAFEIASLLVDSLECEIQDLKKQLEEL